MVVVDPIESYLDIEHVVNLNFVDPQSQINL